MRQPGLGVVWAGWIGFVLGLIVVRHGARRGAELAEIGSTKLEIRNRIEWLTKQRGKPAERAQGRGRAKVGPHGTGRCVSRSGVRMFGRRALIYTYWARCAPGWCRRAARNAEVAKSPGKCRKIFFYFGISYFGALRARDVLARSARVMARGELGFKGTLILAFSRREKGPEERHPHP